MAVAATAPTIVVARNQITALIYLSSACKPLLLTSGFAPTVDEEPEHLWSQLRHLLTPGKISSGSRKCQNIDQTVCQLGTSVEEEIVKLSDSKATHKTNDFLVVMDLEAATIRSLN